jgi:oligosaccharide repeat unit polymerase
MRLAADSGTWNLLYALDLFAIGLFLVSYYRQCYRRGYRIDFWHVELFLACILPNMLMLPFAKSELNGIVLGKDLWPVIDVLPAVFLITLLGYCAVLAGGGLWRLQLGIGLRKTATRVMEIVPRSSMMLMSSKAVLVFQAMLCVLLQTLILSLYFSASGFGFDLRSYTFANPTLRPVALIASNYSIIIASHCFARYAERKERILLACTLLLTFGLLFFGARANLLGVYLGVLLCYLVKLRGRISLLRIGSVVVVIAAIGFYLGRLREGEYSLIAFVGSLAFLLFYGSNFSDLRDFAWVYAGWDHVFWSGKTYLAAILAFVPRFASQFRDTWGLGVATDLTAGLDPQMHPGLRPGMFGEGFFNFGLFGVLVVGLIVGVIVRRVDIDVKRALATPHPSMMKAFASSMLLSIAGCVALSNNSSGLYVLIAAYFFSWFCLCVQRMFQPLEVASGDVKSSFLQSVAPRDV